MWLWSMTMHRAARFRARARRRILVMQADRAMQAVLAARRSTRIRVVARATRQFRVAVNKI